MAFTEFAVDLLIARCMAESGFVWSSTLPADQETIAEQVAYGQLAEFPYRPEVEGVPYATPTPAVSGGSGEPPGMSESEAASYRDAVAGSWSETESVDVLGTTFETPRGGCLNEARRQVFGGLDIALFFESEAFNILARARNNARVEPDTAAVIAVWVTCMGESGFVFEDFTQARALAARSPSESLLIAEADAACSERSNLSEIFRRDYVSQVDSYVEENLAEIQALVQGRDAAVERARALLTNGSQ